jgi:hypothetical protein
VEPLDLRARPPRHPRERLGGLVMLPRTIDKARALLAGGQPGRYFISPGISSYVLDKLGLKEAAFVAAVAAARDDADVAARVLAGVDAARIERWSSNLESLTVARIPSELRPAFDALYGPRAPGELVFEVLADDDAASFAQRRSSRGAG